jgi:flagellar protein FlgJ
VYRARGNINPVIAASMAAHESGWGASELYARARNPLGVKAGKTWTGPTMLLPTQEEEGGELVPKEARWRVYGSLQAAYEDFASIVERLSWYQDAEDAAAVPQDFLDGIVAKRDELGSVKEPGWATDSNYRSKVWSIVTTSRVREMYASLRRGQAPGEPPATTDPVPAPSSPQRLDRSFRVFVLNPPYRDGEAAAFAKAANSGAPFIRRGEHVASITESPVGPKLDVKATGPGSSEVGQKPEKAAVTSRGIWGGVTVLVSIAILVGGPYVGLEIDIDLRNALLGIVAGGGGALAIAGRVDADKKIKGLFRPRNGRQT